MCDSLYLYSFGGNSTSIRYSPGTLKMALALYAKSPSAYRAMKNAGIAILPCESSLKKLRQQNRVRSGVFPEIYERKRSQLADSTDNDGMLIFDEMNLQVSTMYILKNLRMLIIE